MSEPRIPRSAGALAALGVALAGCGGVTGGRVDPGYPTAHPRVTRATSLQTRLNGDVVRFAVPVGWGLARIDTERGARPAFVRLDGSCYLSVSITGSSTRRISAAAIASLYASPPRGYVWRVDRTGRDTLALLDEQNAATGALSRSSLGTVYLPTGRDDFLAIDFGAGVWPLDGHACPSAAVGVRLAPLTAATEAIFSGAVIVPDPDAPASTDTGSSAAAVDAST